MVILIFFGRILTSKTIIAFVFTANLEKYKSLLIL